MRPRLNSRTRGTAATASSTLSTTSPVTPSSTTSGTAPHRKATTGVPLAMASIMARPNGSGQSMGKSSAAALPRNSALSESLISPRNSMPGRRSSGSMTVSK
jgi:hypothetical protein